MFLRLGRDLRGLKCGLWMYCLFLKFEERVCLPVERKPEVQEGPGVGFVQKTTKQCRSRDKVVRASSAPRCGGASLVTEMEDCWIMTEELLLLLLVVNRTLKPT